MWNENVSTVISGCSLTNRTISSWLTPMAFSFLIIRNAPRLTVISKWRHCRRPCSIVSWMWHSVFHFGCSFWCFAIALLFFWLCFCITFMLMLFVWLLVGYSEPHRIIQYLNYHHLKKEMFVKTIRSFLSTKIVWRWSEKSEKFVPILKFPMNSTVICGLIQLHGIDFRYPANIIWLNGKSRYYWFFFIDSTTIFNTGIKISFPLEIFPKKKKLESTEMWLPEAQCIVKFKAMWAVAPRLPK